MLLHSTPERLVPRVIVPARFALAAVWLREWVYLETVHLSASNMWVARLPLSVMQGSNLRPHAPKARALPSELMTVTLIVRFV